MTHEPEQAEYPYIVKIETSTGQATNVPIAFLTAKEVEKLLQSDFKRLVQQAGVKGVRIHVERAPTADYERVLDDVAAYLQTAATKAA